jgi:hypothetical protein
VRAVGTQVFIATALHCAVAFTFAAAQSAGPLPSWSDGKTKQSIGVLAAGERGVVEIMMAAHANMTTEEFDGIVGNWRTKNSRDRG